MRTLAMVQCQGDCLGDSRHGRGDGGNNAAINLANHWGARVPGYLRETGGNRGGRLPWA